MIGAALRLTGSAAGIAQLAAGITRHLCLPLWTSVRGGEGTLHARIGSWECDWASDALAGVEAFVEQCTCAGIGFVQPDISADLVITVEIEPDARQPTLAFWPDTLDRLKRLGMGLVFEAQVHADYHALEAMAGTQPAAAKADSRTEDIARIVAALTEASRSDRGRSASATFALVKNCAPARPLNKDHRRALSSRLAQHYMPPFYSSEGAAKSAASQHARVIWALSHSLGDATATNIAAYLASLRAAAID